jgi:hypothetical protein
MLIDIAGFVLAAGLMLLILALGHRRLEYWGFKLINVDAGNRTLLQVLGIGLMFGSGVLYSYSPFTLPALSAPTVPVIMPMPEADEPDTPAESWLSLMDDALYEMAWDQAAASLKQSLSPTEFQRLAQRRRKPLGLAMDRHLIMETDVVSLPDGREGKFRLLVYRTRFASGRALEETLVMEEESGSWKILNYNVGHILN